MEYRKILNGIIFLILAGSAVIAFWTSNWSNLFVIVVTALLSIVPLYLHKKHDIKISGKLRISIVLFLFSTLFLGEVNHFYETYVWWDAVLHFIAGLGLTIFGFVLLKDIYAYSQLRSTPIMTSFFAFCFTSMVAVVWEIYEFFIDMTGLASDPMQPSNADTMSDLIVALIASGIVCFFGYRYLRYNEKNFAGEMIDDTQTQVNQQNQ